MISVSYTDEQMRAFSQIAYADFTKAYEYLQATEGGNSFSIQQLAETAKQLDPNVNLDMLYCLKDTEMQNWKIAAVHDTNPQNGFYGCIIETGDGNATLAFRGSEGMDNPEGLIHDWLGSDLGLLDSPQTRQHAEVERFLAKYQDQINLSKDFKCKFCMNSFSFLEYKELHEDRKKLIRDTIHMMHETQGD